MKNKDIGKRTVVWNGRCPFWLASLLLIALTLLVGCRPAETDSNAEVASGEAIQNKGSDTLVILAQKWAEVYMAEHPGTTVQVTGGGSGTGFAALQNKTTDLANASRPVKPKEVAACIKAFGRRPQEYKVCLDGLSVYVNEQNPLQVLDLGGIPVERWYRRGDTGWHLWHCGNPATLL